MVLFRIGIYLFDLDRGIILDVQAFSAIIADLVGVEVADLAFHAIIAIFRLI